MPVIVELQDARIRGIGHIDRALLIDANAQRAGKMPLGGAPPGLEEMFHRGKRRGCCPVERQRHKWRRRSPLRSRRRGAHACPQRKAGECRSIQICGRSRQPGRQRKCCPANRPRKTRARRVCPGLRLCLPRRRGTQTAEEAAVSAPDPRDCRKRRGKIRRQARLEEISIASNRNLSSPCGNLAFRDRANFSGRILPRASWSGVAIARKVFKKY